MSTCTGCGTALNHNLEIATTGSGLCPACSTGAIVNPTASVLGTGGCCVESVNGKTGVVVLTINDIDLLGNTFFTTTTVRATISAVSPIVYNSTSGVISHATSGVSAGTYGGASKTVTIIVNDSGHITSIQEHSITTGGVGANVAAIEPLTGTGYLIRTGANTWALRSLSGSSGRINIANPDGVSASSVIDLVATGVTAGTYGSGSTYPVFTVDDYGRIMSATNATFPPITIPAHSHTLDDLSDVSASSPTTGYYLMWNGSAWIPQSIPSMGDDWGTQVVVSDTTLTGTGVVGNVLAVVRPVPTYTTMGYVLTIDPGGVTMSWQAPSVGVGDDWGSQAVVTDVTLSGTGITGNVLTIAQQGATAGQVLNWNGAAWVPTTIATGIVFNKQSTSTVGSWQFCQSPTATDPLFTGNMNNIEGIVGTGAEVLVHIDSIFYLIDVELTQAFVDVHIGNVYAGFMPLAEVILPIGDCLEGSTLNDQVPASFTGSQRLNLSVTIKTNGGIYLNRLVDTTNDSLVSASGGSVSIIVPIFGSYFTKVT